MWLVLVAALASVPPGYADDAVCGGCHADIAKTYEHVAMSKAFYRPRPENLIEDFDAPPFFHEKSKQYFEMRRRGASVLFRRYQLDDEGMPIHVYDQIVDWIIGSGNHARTYVYRTPGGELYQLPVNWYSQTGQWGMAPGYDRADHEGVTRRVRHECMFCHNAYANVPADPLSYWRPQTFPENLPEGLGCQRCHGPGLKHVEAAKAKKARAEIRSTIVNPSRLGTRARNDVCYQCHLQPTVVMPGAVRFGRDVYSFRPGELLADYSVPVDITESDLPRDHRFEINHHPYRLEQSRCFEESEGELGCLTCHNPHKKVAAADRAAHYRKACMSCHVKPHHLESDCTSCHMQNRRTQDVVNVVMTDHFIRRTPGGPELLAPLEEREPSIENVELLQPAVELYRLIPIVRAVAGADKASATRLERLMAEAKPAEIEPYFDLAAVQLRQRRYAELERTALAILDRAPKHPLAMEWLAFARGGRTRNVDEAIRMFETVPALRPEAEFNLGVLLATRGRTAEAMERYQKALAARPNLVAAWIRLGEAQRECGMHEAAVGSFRRALEIDPANERAAARLTSPSPQAGTRRDSDSRAGPSAARSASP